MIGPASVTDAEPILYIRHAELNERAVRGRKSEKTLPSIVLRARVAVDPAHDVRGPFAFGPPEAVTLAGGMNVNRNRRLIAGAAALFLLAGCQPATQNGGTGEPSGMPGDTTTTDTSTMDTVGLAPQVDGEGSAAHATVAQLEPVS